MQIHFAVPSPPLREARNTDRREDRCGGSSRSADRTVSVALQNCYRAGAFSRARNFRPARRIEQRAHCWLGFEDKEKRIVREEGLEPSRAVKLNGLCVVFVILCRLAVRRRP